LRDFAADTLIKNGTDINFNVNTLSDTILTDRVAILKEVESISYLRDFAADTLAKNGTDAIFTPDTLSDPNFKNIILPVIKAVFVSDASETAIFQTNDGGNELAENQPILFINNFFANFSKSKNFYYFKDIKFFLQFDHFWYMLVHSNVPKNLEFYDA
jgi:fucose 4-O-acetylase-like acetyltransferase